MTIFKTVLSCAALAAFISTADAHAEKTKSSASTAKAPCACCVKDGDKSTKITDKSKSAAKKNNVKTAKKRA